MGYARKLADGQVCRIWTYDVVTGRASLVHRSDSVLFEAPNWAADGSLVVNGDGVLWRVPADGSGEPRRIEFDGLPELNNDHVLAPDLVTVYMSANDGHIYAGALRGGAVRRVTGGDGVLHFLHGVGPDGASLAYVRIDGDDWGSASISTLNADGTGDRRVTSPGGVDDGPEYAADGGWIYFNSERFDGHAQIGRMRVDGSGLRQLTFDDRVNWFPHLAPDGERAVYLSFPAGTRGHPADLRVELRLVDGEAWHAARTVVSLDGGQGTINVNSWSPDSRHFAYVDYPADT